MTIQRLCFAVFALALCIIAWLQLGFYSDREWGGLYVFVKHRPSLHVFFYSPIGEADPSPIEGKEGFMDPAMQEEELLFQEFIEANRGYARGCQLF